jgi:hypothetical protein
VSGEVKLQQFAVQLQIFRRSGEKILSFGWLGVEDKIYLTVKKCKKNWGGCLRLKKIRPSVHVSIISVVSNISMVTDLDNTDTWIR